MSGAMSNSLPRTLEPVTVPRGCFPIEVTQFWRGEYSRGHPLPLHWAIVVRTSAHAGNRHEIVGDTETYATQDRFNVPIYETTDPAWRGSHVIGYVRPDKLEGFLTHMALVPVKRRWMSWNCQNWVFDVLQGLNRDGLYTDINMTFSILQRQMNYLLEAWELGDI